LSVIAGSFQYSFGLNSAARVVLFYVSHPAMEAGMMRRSSAVKFSLVADWRKPGSLPSADFLISGDLREMFAFDPLAELTTLFEGATTKRDRSQDESLP